MIVNLGTPQYTVQDVTLYRNKQGLVLVKREAIKHDSKNYAQEKQT